MKDTDYIKTIVVNDRMVNIGLDDYGQCYYFEYYDEEEKELKDVSCGTYNFNYEEEIEAYFKG